MRDTSGEMTSVHPGVSVAGSWYVSDFPAPGRAMINQLIQLGNGKELYHLPVGMMQMMSLPSIFALHTLRFLYSAWAVLIVKIAHPS